MFRGVGENSIDRIIEAFRLEIPVVPMTRSRDDLVACVGGPLREAAGVGFRTDLVAIPMDDQKRCRDPGGRGTRSCGHR